MKLNNTQIKALAQEVLNKIPETKKGFTKEQLVKFTKISKKYNDLQSQIDKFQKEQNDLREEIKNTGLFRCVYHSDISDVKELEKELILKEQKPKLEEIVHKITLETIFETKDSMNDFIDNLVKQYTK